MKKFYLIFALLIISVLSFSQVYKGKQAGDLVNGADMVRYKEHSKIPSYIRLSGDVNLDAGKAVEYTKKFISSENSELLLKNIQENGKNEYTHRYTQTLNGYPIEFSSWNLQIKNNRVFSMNGNILDKPVASTEFNITEEEALIIALSHMGAQLYMWEDESEERLLKSFKNDNNETYYPKGEKIIVPDNIEFEKSGLRAAYKFNIFSKKPLDRKMVYVDAQTGEILFDLPLIQVSDEIGTAHTQYNGIQQINTEYNGTNYILRDNTRGGGIVTQNCMMTADYGLAQDFTDDDNIWNNINPQLDQYATDAHFSTMKTFDYYKNIHNRNSIDNNNHPLWSFVHFNLIEYGYGSNVNAFWNGEWMTYGDGDQTTTPLTTIDICGHEITHGLTQFTANLIYYKESGALNESFSDIFGTAIEFYAVPEYADWTCGEDIGRVLRSLENPKSYGDPDTYRGEYWIFTEEDNGGVHTNSGPMNYWFYLLSEGGSGTNDHGNSYTVNGIGINKAEKIAFKLLTQYLYDNSNYQDAYFYGMIAAMDLYGDCSPEVKAVGEAFYAIGVAEEPYVDEVHADFTANLRENCSAPFEVEFNNISYNGNNFLWDFGDGNTSTETNPTHTFTSEGNFNVSLTVTSSTCGSNNETKNEYIKIDPSFPCIKVMGYNSNSSIEGCEGTIFPPGGADGYNHLHEVNSTLVIHSPGASQIILNISDFYIEMDYNYSCEYSYIAFYDGNSTSSPLINMTKYCVMDPIPETISSTGEYITIKLYNEGAFATNRNNNFRIDFNCLGESYPPLPEFIADKTSSCDNRINFTDNSLGISESWEWDFGDGNTSNDQNPSHTYNNNGTYSVKLTTSNSNGSRHLLKENYITVQTVSPPPISNLFGCENENFEINVDHLIDGEIHWYNNIEDENPVHIGNFWHHSPIIEDKIYYIKEVFNNDILNLGPTNNTSGGDYHTQDGANHHLVFDAYMPFKLKSVSINANYSFSRTIALLSSTGEVLAYKDVYIPNGVSRVTLDMDIPIGNDLKLACLFTSYLFRSDNSAGISYPYKIDNVVSIKSGSNNTLDYYYYFYDWEIETGQCESSFSEVTVYSSFCCANVGTNKILNNISVAPNPSNGIFEIFGLNDLPDYSITLTDIYGKKIYEYNNTNNNMIDLTNFSEGMYFLRVSTPDGHKIIKLVNQK